MEFTIDFSFYMQTVRTFPILLAIIYIYLLLRSGHEPLYYNACTYMIIIYMHIYRIYDMSTPVYTLIYLDNTGDLVSAKS